MIIECDVLIYMNTYTVLIYKDTHQVYFSRMNHLIWSAENGVTSNPVLMHCWISSNQSQANVHSTDVHSNGRSVACVFFVPREINPVKIFLSILPTKTWRGIIAENRHGCHAKALIPVRAKSLPLMRDNDTLETIDFFRLKLQQPAFWSTDCCSCAVLR